MRESVIYKEITYKVGQSVVIVDGLSKRAITKGSLWKIIGFKRQANLIAIIQGVDNMSDSKELTCHVCQLRPSGSKSLAIWNMQKFIN